MIQYKARTHRKVLDLFITISLVLLGVLLAISLNLNFLLTTLLFFGLPSLYLVWRDPRHTKKALLAAALFGLLWGFSFDYIAEFNHSWGWSTNTALTFPIQFFGVVSLDIMVWYFLWVFLIVLFYEYFVHKNVPKKISPKAWLSVIVGIIVLFAVVWLSKVYPAELHLPYPYLILGLLTLIPFIYIVIKRPKLWMRYLKVTPFFIFLYIAFELTALYLHLWGFTGQYIGTVEILNLKFPLEELLFWIIASSAVTASYFEYFIDDLK